MKKVLCLVLALLLASAGALAHASAKTPEFSGLLFENGKDALWLIANGDYKLALQLLNFSQGAPSEEDFAAYIRENFPSIAKGPVQYEVSVAYYDGWMWTLAIPVLEPVDGEIETFVLFSENGEQFDGCGYMLWSDVEEECECYYDVIWNLEYCPESMLVIVDDGNNG